MKIAIVNFNSASITKTMEEFEHLYTVKLDVSINEKSYVDKTIDELFVEAERVKQIPKTSQPTPENFLNVYKEVEKSYDNIIVLTPDPELSGTHQAAVSALELIDEGDKFHIVNTKSFALSEAILCDRAIEMINSNSDIKAIIKDIEALANKITTYIIPGSFEYLKMGGRVNLPKLIIGKLMNLKILVEHKEGIANVRITTRGFKKLFSGISEILKEYDIKEMYTAEIRGEEVLYNSLVELFSDLKTTKTTKTSIIMAAHFGPNTLGFAVIQNN